MKKKRTLLNFIFLELCMIIMYLFSFYETGVFQGSVRPFVYVFEVIMTIFTIIGMIICVRTLNRISNIDNLTEIGNSDWIVNKGGKLHFQKKLSQSAGGPLPRPEYRYHRPTV